MNKMYLILFALFLCSAHAVSASNTDDFLKERFENEEEAKNIKITAVKNASENQNNSFWKIFKIKPISSIIIFHLDPPSVGRLQQVCKDIQSRIILISNKSLEINFIKDNFLLYNEHLKFIGKNTATLTSGLFFSSFYAGLKELMNALKDPQSQYPNFEKALNSFQNLMCLPVSEDEKQTLKSIEEEYINPLFMRLLLVAQEGKKKTKKILEKVSADDNYFPNIFSSNYVSLFLNFALKQECSMDFIKNILFMPCCFYNNLTGIKFILKNGFDLNQKFDKICKTKSYRDKTPIEILAASYENIDQKRKKKSRFLDDSEDDEDIIEEKLELSQKYLNIMIFLVQHGADINGLNESPVYKVLQKYGKDL